MANLTLQTGLGGSVFASGYPGAATPAAAGPSAQGPTTVGQKAFGIVTGSPGCSRTPGLALISGGTLSLALLVYIWWSLPR
jgi:hypothetical protein